MRNEIETEHHLSALLTGLRKEGKLTPYDFLKLHPKYLSGETNTFYKLSQEIHKSSNLNLSDFDIKQIIEEADKKAKIDFEEIQRLKKVAQDALELIDIAENTIKLKDDEIKRLSDLAAGKEDYTTWWAVGGVIVGIGLTIAVVYAVDARNIK